MIIKELEIVNILGCGQVHLRFANLSSGVYVVHSLSRCAVVTTAIQLICSAKYAALPKLHELRKILGNGKLCMTFLLPRQERTANVNEIIEDESELPCSSQQAREREARRRRRNCCQKQVEFLEIKACRDFQSNPALIAYTLNGGPQQRCSVRSFQMRFFTCTDLILPRLVGLSEGECSNGKWMDLLSTELTERPQEKKGLFDDFWKCYSRRLYDAKHVLCQLTHSVLVGLKALNVKRSSDGLCVFRDIRSIFESVTCMEYTVWFLIPTTYGNYIDVTHVTVEDFDFDNMETYVQLKSTDSPVRKLRWSDAEQHVQELLLIAFQIAFAYHSRQNIVYLHRLDYLKQHQSFEMVTGAFAQKFGGAAGNWSRKNYLQRIIDMCAAINITALIEFTGGLPVPPFNANVIQCRRDESTESWQIRVLPSQQSSCSLSDFVNDINVSLEKYEKEGK